MKKLIASASCALLLCGSAYAGPFSLANYDAAPAHVTIPATVLAEVLDDQADVSVPAKTSSDVAKVNRTIAKQNKPASVGLAQSKGTTRGACANGQCGR